MAKKPKTFVHINSITGVEYFLHAKLAANAKTPLRYFSKTETAEHSLDSVPEGYEVVEGKGGFPMLKKIVAA
jgi:hypothetical protein